MNIKSLILGSAAVLVAGGAAQAADLPVAEPVDYVKVCDAYGAGYFFIPGTDTCLKIGGYARTEATFSEGGRDVQNFDIWARGYINFFAKEETELGTLSSRISLQGDTGKGEDQDVDLANAYISLGGFYAGRLDASGVVTDYVGSMYGGDFDLGDVSSAEMGYNFALGNGVYATVAIANNRNFGDLNGATAGNGWAGQTLPTAIARLKVDQAWGSASVSGVVMQARYGSTVALDSDVAYSVAAGGVFNLDMLSEGSNFAVNGFYTKGALAWNGVGDSDYMAAASKVGTEYKLSELYGASASVKFAFADNLWTIISGGYGEYDEKAGSTNDYDFWVATGEVGYTPVKNLTLTAGVSYTDRDFNKYVADADTWAGKLRIQRNF